MDLKTRLQSWLPPFPRYLGIVITDAGPDRIIAELPVREELCIEIGTVHGGVIMAFADTLGAMGAIANLPEGKWTTTLESKTYFISPAPLGTRLIGEATPLHRGRRTQIWETRIGNEAGKLVAKVTQTQRVL
jgi:1,4-dihydroxy-2-naphthoyl-CoA hydrolase